MSRSITKCITCSPACRIKALTPCFIARAVSTHGNSNWTGSWPSASDAPNRCYFPEDNLANEIEMDSDDRRRAVLSMSLPGIAQARPGKTNEVLAVNVNHSSCPKHHQKRLLCRGNLKDRPPKT
jgi:hypothetical protein